MNASFCAVELWGFVRDLLCIGYGVLDLNGFCERFEKGGQVCGQFCEDFEFGVEGEIEDCACGLDDVCIWVGGDSISLSWRCDDFGDRVDDVCHH